MSHSRRVASCPPPWPLLSILGCLPGPRVSFRPTRPLVPTVLQQSNQVNVFLKENSFTKQASGTVDGIAFLWMEMGCNGHPGAIIALALQQANKPQRVRTCTASQFAHLGRGACRCEAGCCACSSEYGHGRALLSSSRRLSCRLSAQLQGSLNSGGALLRRLCREVKPPAAFSLSVPLAAFPKMICKASHTRRAGRRVGNSHH